MLTQMSLNRKAQLESAGFTVYEKYENGRRFTYIHHPDNNLSDPFHGQDLKWFSSLADVDHYQVSDGEYIDLEYYSWPVDYCPPNPNGDYKSMNEAWTEQQVDASGRLLDPVTLGLLLIAVALTVTIIVSCLVWFIETLADPCGQTSWVDINDCWKIIRRPDCKTAEFNSCGGPDSNNDGVPDGQWAGAAPGESGKPNWQGGMPDLTELMYAVVIGAVAIAGVYVAIKFLTKEKSQPQYYYPPPQPKYQSI